MRSSLEMVVKNLLVNETSFIFIHFLTVGHNSCSAMCIFLQFSFSRSTFHRLEMGLVVLRGMENVHYIIQN